MYVPAGLRSGVQRVGDHTIGGGLRDRGPGSYIYMCVFSTNHLYITIGLPNFDLYIWLVVDLPL